MISHLNFKSFQRWVMRGIYHYDITLWFLTLSKNRPIFSKWKVHPFRFSKGHNLFLRKGSVFGDFFLVLILDSYLFLSFSCLRFLRTDHNIYFKGHLCGYPASLVCLLFYTFPVDSMMWIYGFFSLFWTLFYNNGRAGLFLTVPFDFGNFPSLSWHLEMDFK